MRVITAVVVFFAIVWSATADAQVQIQDKPTLLAKIDIYKMEDEAAIKWAEVLPRLDANYLDYYDAWGRLQDRLQVARLRWAKLAEASSGHEYREMWAWCSNLVHKPHPNYFGEEKDKAGKKFAALDVRTRMCEEKLPPQKPAEIKFRRKNKKK